MIVGVIIRDTLGRIVLVKQRFDESNVAWSLPAGKIDHGESLADAAVREVAEETGLILTAFRHIAYTLHYVLPGSGDGVSVFIIEADATGDLGGNDPDGDVLFAAYIEPEEALRRLAELPSLVMREPMLGYLLGEYPPGTMWSFASDGTNQMRAMVVSPPAPLSLSGQRVRCSE